MADAKSCQLHLQEAERNLWGKSG